MHCLQEICDNKDWEVVKTQLIKSYGTQINTTATCKGIFKLYQVSKSVLDYFLDVRDFCKVSIKLSTKDYMTDLTFPQDIITEEAAGAHSQLDPMNFISDANKQNLNKHWGEKIAIATANFILVQIFIEGLKPEIKNEMIKKSWLTLADAFDKEEELEKHAEQKALESTKIYETSVDYMGSTSNRGNLEILYNLEIVFLSFLKLLKLTK
jgi:hypothetical protein